MWRTLAAATDRIRMIAGTVTQLLAAGHTRGRARIALIALGVVALLSVAGGVHWTWRATATPTSRGAASTEWRYLVVCSQCGHRTRMTTHPRTTLPESNGLLRCPGCGNFQASWYRRGGQTIPPGGWGETLSPGAEPTEDAARSGRP